jgi:hypothetical protein
MFAISKGNHNIDCGGKVNNSFITNTEIDMNGKVITSHGTPVNSQDVANKQYVDASIAVEIIISIATLSGTNYTLISSDLSGDFQIFVKNIILNGPSATFTLVKSESARQPSYTRSGSCPGLTTHERLDVKWDPGDGIRLKKTGVNYNGNYRIKIIKTN